jgi:thiol-disulfide isomerase/thioredoxin
MMARAALTTIVLLFVGCVGKTHSPAEVALRTIDAAGLTKTLAERRGQVVVVDFWATWCGPCLELFPHNSELLRRFRDRGLTVITISLDDPDNRPAVQKFLDQKGAEMENYIAVYGVGPAAFTAFDIDDGALPHLRVYDRQGKLRRTFTSGGKTIDSKDLERTVEGLMSE